LQDSDQDETPKPLGQIPNYWDISLTMDTALRSTGIGNDCLYKLLTCHGPVNESQSHAYWRDRLYTLFGNTLSEIGRKLFAILQRHTGI